MTYQKFKSQICETLQKALGSQVTVTIKDIIKNNGTHMDGLTVFSSMSNLSPTIYLNPYFEQYEKGKSLSDICDDILSAYRANKPTGNIDITFFTDYDKVKSRIIYKLVNYERNRELLKNVPHFRFLDLAIVFNCLLLSDFPGNATILIHDHHLSLWGITKDDLYALALKNTPVLLKYDLRNMTDVLKELLAGEDFCDFPTPPAPVCPMYVLSNQYKLNGSGCILYQNLLKNFAERLQSDLYILPSSIHEVLILPAHSSDSYRDLSDMVKEVNASQLSCEEILSDHVYYFSRETCRLSM